MSINFNTNPYYDDFDETKNFHRVLFKPGMAVQARELTQLQTALQKQIDRFGKHIFKEGSIVLGGQFNLETDVDTVRLTDGAGTNTDLTTLVGNIIVGQTNGIRAYVHAVADKETWGEAEDILMIRYLSGSASTNLFAAGEQLTLEGATSPITQTVKSSGATGKGTLFTIQEGTVFTKGYFVSFVTQKIILSPISQTPTGKVGFESSEEIINSNQDASLLDPALGSYNYSAPGADRLKVSVSLTLLDLNDDLTSPDFTTLFIIKDGQMTQSYERTEYARIYDEFAKRTFDESGDYVVRGLGVRVREHLNTGTNDGYLTLANGGDVTKLAVGVEPGLAYVKGYEVNNYGTQYLTINKSTDTRNVNNEVLSARNGNYITANQVVGSIASDTAQLVTLYDTAEQRTSNNTSQSNTTPIGNAIGTAKVKAVEYNSADNYNIYLFDIQMTGSNTFSNVRAIGNTTYSTGFFADTVLTSGSSVLQDPAQSLMLYSLGSDYVANVRSDSSGVSQTNFTFKRTQTVTINLDGTFTISVSPENHSYGTSGTLSDTEKNTIFLSINEQIETQLTGTVDVSSGLNTVTGSGTSFTNLNVGDKITVATVSGVYTVQTIVNNTSLTVTSNFSSSATGQNYNKIYQVGDIIDLKGKGFDAGTERSITVTSASGLSFDLQETYGSTIAATVSYNVTRSAGEQVNKTLVPKVYVQINADALSSNTVPIDLGISDLYRIHQIRQKTGSTFTSNTEGTLVTSDFTIDNGQRDDFYDHAKITPRVSLTSNTWLLVELDYFKPDFSSGFGYFSVESYPVDDTTESDTTIFTHQIPVYKSTYSGNSYNLRNYLDFRPVKTNTAADATTPSTATVNPGSSDTFNIASGGLRLPNPASQIYCDYYYYLARRDTVVTDNDGILRVISGISDIYPVSPSISDDVMGIANLYIPPYPSLATTYGRILNKTSDAVSIRKITNVRHTMRDIGALKQRIENLEYYNALSLLEKNTVDLLILDSSGNDRFKNGFFVDGFVDHSLGATYNSDYNISVDKVENVIRPVFEMNSFAFNYANTLSSNVVKTGDLITLPYTETALIEQSRVTTIRNIEQSVFRFVGNITLTPDVDVWADVKTVDKTIEYGNDIPNKKLLTTEWNSWQTYQTGSTVYNVYARNFGDRSGDLSQAQLVGTYTSYADALAASNSVGTLNRNDTTNRGYIETVTAPTSSVRTGVQTVASTQKIQQQIGTYVTDISMIPYIRSQTIDVVVRGLKANTTYYTFFDSEDMTDYVTPATLPEESISTANIASVAVYTTEGSAWRTNSYGMLVGKLRLPENKQFRVGTKEVIITDSPTNAVDATSYAKNYFYASGVYAQKQNTILSTKQTVYTTKTVTETKATEGQQTVNIFGPSCMAYSFKVEAPAGEPGVFLTSVDVYINQVHPTLGVWFEIREMSQDGGITRNQVPYSEVWYTSDEITTTDDATTPHNVAFASPVFLQNNTQYAFVIHTEGLNPDTYFWVSRLGETDIITNTPVTGRQLTGSLFTTNNNLNWDIVPDVDLKVKFNRAVFNTGVTGTAVFGNKPYELLQINNYPQKFTNAGETINTNQILTLADLSGTIYVGNLITQGSNTANVLSIDGTSYYTDGYLFTTGSITSNAITGNITSISAGTGRLISHDDVTDKVILDVSSGGFFANAIIKGATSNNTATVTKLDEYVYSTVNFKPRHLQLQNTTVAFDMKGILLATNVASSYTSFTPDTSYEFDNEFTIKSRSTEINDLSSANSALMRATLTSTSEYVSPVVDISTTHNVFVYNDINTDTTNEDLASGGNLTNKYISKTVTLADGQDAEDLIVKIKAYLPPSTDSDIKIWMKIKNVDDAQEFNLRPWIEMSNDSSGVYSSLANRNDFIDYSFSIPTSMLTGPNQEVQYTGSNNATFTGFKQFAIKIGIIGSDTAIVPKVGDLRAIALQK